MGRECLRGFFNLKLYYIMKILKSNGETDLVFDTDTSKYHEVSKVDRKRLIALHHYTHSKNINLRDYDFLSNFFESKHPIFEDFSNSFFYVLDADNQTKIS